VVAAVSAASDGSIAGRLITSQLYQTSAYNLLLLAMTISILGVAALVACLFPARRASLINPIDALRIE
jgi:putative ABC transport system permease protein